MKRLLPTLAALLLFPSCQGWVQWDIGGCIREGSEAHVGANTHGPCVRYEKKGDKNAPTYYLAPEVLYRTKHHIVKWTLAPRTEHEKAKAAYELRPTGHQLLVLGKNGDVLGLAETLPAGYKAVRLPGCNCGKTKSATDRLGMLDRPQATRGSLAAQLAAAPFDFVIDPALTAVSTAATYAGFACAGVLLLPYVLINPDALP